MLWFKIITHHAWGDSSPEYKLCSIENLSSKQKKEYKDELAEEIHNRYYYSDKYRGCTIKIVSKPPKIVLEQTLRRAKDSVKYNRTIINKLNKL